MRRQFLRVYIGMGAVLVLAALVTAYWGEREMRRAVNQRVGNYLRPLVQDMQGRLIETADDSLARAQTLQRLEERVPFPIRIQTADQLDLAASDLRRLADGETVFVRGRGRERMIYAPLEGDEVLVIAPPPRRVSQRWRSHLPAPPQWSPMRMVGVLLAILALIGGALYLLIRPLERRIYALANTARRFGQGQLDARAPTGGDDAVAELSSTFNWMAERIGDLIERQKELLRAVSHELRTPLARLFFVLDEAQTTAEAAVKDRHLGRMEKSLTELNGLIEELLTFVRLEDEEAYAAVTERTDVHRLLADLPDVAAELRADIAVSFQCPPVNLPAEARLLRRAALNLLTNAVRHARSQVDITAHSAGDTFFLTVDDDGEGIPAEARQHLFEPFFRLDESRNARLGGTGLGLAIVRRVAQRHGGRVSVGDSPQGGARFVLELPLKANDADDADDADA